jgi:hypothetical protein
MKRQVKNYINYALEILLSVALLGIVVSSYIVWFILPRGTGTHGSPYCSRFGLGGAGNAVQVLGWPRYTWIEIHNWLGVALAALVLIHVILHWRWILETTRRARSYISGRMTRIKELYISAAAVFLLFVFEVLSGCVMWLILPRGRYDYYNMVYGSGRTFWGLQRNVWVDLHGWVAVTILAIIVIHLILNWSWVVATTGKIFRGIWKRPEKVG